RPAPLPYTTVFRSAACQFERLLLDLAVGDVAHHGDDLGLRLRGLLGQSERPATHFDPDEVDLTAWTVLPVGRKLPPHAKLDAARFAASRGVEKCREIGRAIGDMDP